MTAPMLTLDAETSIKEAASAMRETSIKSVVVVSEGCQPAGIFTSADALAVLSDAATAEEATVGAYMTSDPETIAPDATLTAAVDQMHDGGYSHLPVTDADGDGVGILTKTDVARVLSASASDSSALLAE